MALCVGEDLTDADRRERLRHHLTGCPECRTHLKRLKGMFHVLEQAEGQQTYDSTDSLWPGLAGRLGEPRPRMQGPRFNGWVPFSVMAAACVLLMFVMEMQPDPHTAISGSILPGVPRSVLDLGNNAGHAPETELPESTYVENRDPTRDPTNSALFGPSSELLDPDRKERRRDSAPEF